MHFLIFVPRIDAAQPTLDAAGLGDFAANSTPFALARGPGGGPGTLFGWTKPTDPCREFGFFPDRQTWSPSKPAGRYWVGLWNDSPPTPAELLRTSPFDGGAVRLGDGQSWRIPAAARLPKTCVLSDDGEPGFRIADQFQEFWRESETYFFQLVLADAGDEDIIIDANWWSYLCRALRLNYRIVPEVVSELRLFSTDTMLEAVLATVEGRPIHEAVDQKKTDATLPVS